MCGDPRPGVPRKITDADVERVIVKTLEGGDAEERDPLVDEVVGRGQRPAFINDADAALCHLPTETEPSEYGESLIVGCRAAISSLSRA
ncbi:hypothetical protein GCM10027168_11270 [Streptomyces capparidis]